MRLNGVVTAASAAARSSTTEYRIDDWVIMSWIVEDVAVNMTGKFSHAQDVAILADERTGNPDPADKYGHTEQSVTAAVLTYDTRALHRRCLDDTTCKPIDTRVRATRNVGTVELCGTDCLGELRPQRAE